SADSFDKIWGRSGAPHGLFIVRPKRGVSLDAVRGQLRAILRRLAHAGLGIESERRLANVEPMLTPGLGVSPEVRPSIESALHLLAGVIALVLLIACANVANLLLFRNVARRRMVTTQRALGASPGRIAREHLVQSLVLGVLGSAAGLGVGWLIAFAFRGQTLGRGPAFQGLPLDHRIAIFAALASVVTALLFGTLPAALAGRFDLASALRQTGLHHTGRAARFRSTLAAAQLALTLTLGVGALLLVRTVHNLNTADTGLDFRGVAFMWQSHRLNMTRAEADALARRVMAAVERVPGVQRAALGPPDLDPHPGARVMARVGPPGAPDDARVDARIVPVTPGWFRIFHIPTASGRVFSEHDWKEGPPYNVVLTASLARKLFGSENAVGRTLDGAGHTSAGVFSRPELHVIGVVPNLSGNQSPGVPKDAVFVTYAFRPVTGSFSLVLRTRRFDAQMAQSIRTAIHGVLPNELVDEPVPLSAASAHREQETLSQLLVLLSALAAILAAVGLYGVIAFAVAGRRRELAIRVALGAEAWRIARLVVRFAAAIIGTGTLLGLGGTYVMSRALQGRLFGVGPLDPASYIVGATLLGVVAAVACAIPALRAVRVDPVATLREE
ncbi:MAG TPA: FtsX-like permease family protein, partial [Gemmatimonadaceae bacterium]|nr:FtsX-like permease family protein [Gemmatimonadaceae bacterium]